MLEHGSGLRILLAIRLGPIHRPGGSVVRLPPSFWSESASLLIYQQLTVQIYGTKLWSGSSQVHDPGFAISLPFILPRFPQTSPRSWRRETDSFKKSTGPYTSAFFDQIFMDSE
jgi:hypothetical protein